MIKSNRLKKQKYLVQGFTLIEVIIVMAILSLLSVLLIPHIIKIISEAEKSHNISSAKTLASEVAVYNSIAKMNGTTTIPNPLPGVGTVELTKTMLDGTSISLKASEDFPDNLVVKVLIDSEGNTSIVY